MKNALALECDQIYKWFSDRNLRVAYIHLKAKCFKDNQDEIWLSFKEMVEAVGKLTVTIVCGMDCLKV